MGRNLLEMAPVRKSAIGPTTSAGSPRKVAPLASFHSWAGLAARAPASAQQQPAAKPPARISRWSTEGTEEIENTADRYRLAGAPSKPSLFFRTAKIPPEFHLRHCGRNRSQDTAAR